MEVPIIDISFPFLLYYFVLHQELRQFDESIAGPPIPDTGIANAQAGEHERIQDRICDAFEGFFQCLSVCFLRHGLKVEDGSSVNQGLELVPFYEFREAFLVHLECERREITVADERCMDLAYLSVGFVPGDLEDGFRLVVELRPDMAANIVIGLVQV